jgi:hypothetical protein
MRPFVTRFSRGSRLDDSAPRAFMLVAASQTVQRFPLGVSLLRVARAQVKALSGNHHEMRRCPNRALELPAECW